MRRSALVLAMIAGGAGAAVGSSAWAHHSAGAIYDLEQHVEVEGVVTRFNLGNPHMRIFFTRADGAGGEEWMAEGGSRTVLLRKGWSPDTVHFGDTVIISGNPSRDGSPAMHIQKLTLPDGRELWAEDTPSPEEIEALRARRAQPDAQD